MTPIAPTSTRSGFGLFSPCFKRQAAPEHHAIGSSVLAQTSLFHPVLFWVTFAQRDADDERQNGFVVAVQAKEIATHSFFGYSVGHSR